ncbi:helix-turn-helix transcriptional regulator [Paenibacillus sp. FSL W8-0187]|uniref:Transcriptional regulator n=1 Tax=Paenibacillus lautus TaxID=1401 RepID=A0A1R1AE52_PAELA|nr:MULTISPECIES: helix-turn-helix transcriptional regulator [Paenibacillus]MCV4235882.1 helix-turn-helix transcriptional regulator [Virgibacillus sp. LDC1]MEC0206250.1 helix-turn-helix transcriptional regulator [Paenibacillus lautus]MEC0259977.1 helix-turn-helix transcriptional regulator [Paenibacillus lautus]MEC0310777.1 helix-turn-helix transcriptional regulator [Paenibacillus lautus]OME83851.1 transcriptional regulator [Paenibacillus lautus]
MENKQLAQRIRAFRKLKGLTQQELAERTGISLAVLGAIERGNRRAEEQMLAQIADVLEITLQELKERS